MRRLLKLDNTVNQAVSLNKSEEKKLAKVSSKVASKIPSSEKCDDEATLSEPVDKNDLDSGSESVFNFINKEELAMQRGAVGRFLLILAALYRAHPNKFKVVSNIGPKVSARKTKRLYFALSEDLLTASGSSTKPKQVPQSPYWVITNSNTTRKKMMLTEAAMLLGYNDDDVIKIRELL